MIEQQIDYDIQTLRLMIIKLKDGDRYGPVNFHNGWPVHLILTPDNLPGEAFKVDPETGAEASNLGRIRKDGVILPQTSESEEHYDYLVVKGLSDNMVYRCVARAWLPHDVARNEVHHLTNNGYDNRPSNLLYVTRDEHQEIEQGILRY